MTVLAVLFTSAKIGSDRAAHTSTAAIVVHVVGQIFLVQIYVCKIAQYKILIQEEYMLNIAGKKRVKVLLPYQLTMKIDINGNIMDFEKVIQWTTAIQQWMMRRIQMKSK